MNTNKPVTRPALRYHGGKFKMAPRIIAQFPPHRVYTETFGGGASILLLKKRAYAEVYNDLDGDIVNLFQVYRDQGVALKEVVYYTPFSRAEFELAYTISSDPLERARRTLIRAYQGFGSAGATQQRTGFRANSNRSGTTPAHDWANFPRHMDAIMERLRGVVIENKDALEVMRQHDTPQTLHYVDPPYVLATRNSNTQSYRHEMSDDQHVKLCDHLLSLTGMVVLSGYATPLYDSLIGWQRLEMKALADGASPRTEVLWLNPAAVQQSTRLFA